MFLDWEKSFDKIDIKSLFIALRQLGVPHTFLGDLESIY